MKVVFLNPPRIQRSIAGFKIKSPVYRFTRGCDLTHTTVAPPTELAALAAVVEEDGVDVDIVDANGLDLSPKETCQRIRELKPDYLVVRVGYGTFTDDIIFHEYAEKAGIPSIVWENTLNPYYSKRMTQDFGLKRLMFGDPEEVVFRFLDGEEGALQGDAIGDLDSLPLPLMEKLPMNRYKKGGSIWWYAFVQRGCIWSKCSFCLEYGNPLRMRSMDHIRQEIQEAKKYGVDGVFFWGPGLNVTKERILGISEIMKDNQLKWECWFRADVADEEILEKMKKSGCEKLSIGVENGDQTVLDAVNKGITLEQIRETFRLTRLAGIATNAFHIVGTPYDTTETFKKTLKLFREIKPAMNVPIPFMPWPERPLTEIARKRGLLVRDLYEACIGGDCLIGCVFYVPPGMSREELDCWIGVFNREASKSAKRYYIKRPRDWGFVAEDFLSRRLFDYVLTRRMRDRSRFSVGGT